MVEVVARERPAHVAGRPLHVDVEVGRAVHRLALEPPSRALERLHGAEDTTEGPRRGSLPAATGHRMPACSRPPSSAAAWAGRSSSTEEPKLRLELLEAQRALQKAGVPVIVLLGGADGAGKGETVSRVLEWLDTRGLDTHAFGAPTDEERERPRWWRYWMRLPPRGRIGIFFGSWYSEPLVERAFGRLSRARYDRMLSEIAFFEQMLAEDGALDREALDPPVEEGAPEAPRAASRPTRPRAGRSRRPTGSTSRSTTATSRRRSTRSGGPTRATRPGCWSRPRTSATATSWPGARCSSASAAGWPKRPRGGPPPPRAAPPRRRR